VKEKRKRYEDKILAVCWKDDDDDDDDDDARWLKLAFDVTWKSAT